MTESEITADLTKENFDLYIEKFTKELGNPELKKRISFIVWEPKKPLDNRVRITNGQARMTQKIKSKATETGKRTNEEYEFDIPNDLEAVKFAIKLFENFYNTYNIEVLKLVVQHENYLWATKDFELKITRQFGKQDLYLYEIETLGGKSPEEIQEELGIKADYNSFSPERQALRREVIDIPFNELSEKEFDDLIIKYLNY